MAALKDGTSSTVNSWTATWRHYTTTNTNTITNTNTFSDNNTTTSINTTNITDLLMDKEASPSFHFHVTGPSMDGSNTTTVGPSDITVSGETGTAAATGMDAANASLDRAVEEVKAEKAEAGPMFNLSSTSPSTSLTTTEQHTDTILNTTTVTEGRVPAPLPSDVEVAAMREVKDGEQGAVRRHDGGRHFKRHFNQLRHHRVGRRHCYYHGGACCGGREGGRGTRGGD